MPVWLTATISALLVVLAIGSLSLAGSILSRREQFEEKLLSAPKNPEFIAIKSPGVGLATRRIVIALTAHQAANGLLFLSAAVVLWFQFWTGIALAVTPILFALFLKVRENLTRR